MGRNVNGRLLWLWTIYLLWSIAMKAALFVIYFALISTGFLNVYPDTGLKLFKLPIPGFSLLEDYEWTYQLRIAHFCAVVLLVLTWLSWSLLLQIHLGDELVDRFRRWGWNIPQVKTVLTIGGGLVILGDAGLFYNALQYTAFGGAAISPFTLVASLVWAVILVLVNFISLFLSRSVKEEAKYKESL